MKKTIDEVAQRFKMYERFSRYGESIQEEYYDFYLDELIEFVELFIKQEREACAKVCDRMVMYGPVAEVQQRYNKAYADCRDKIRERGEK
jgi:hypothetical protein